MSRIIPKQGRANATKAKIMRVGHDVVQRDGRDNFSTTTITQEAGVSAGIFYRYWSSGADFLRELYPAMIEGLGAPRFPDEVQS
jgi:AcrR family transcriptional regulator